MAKVDLISYRKEKHGYAVKEIAEHMRKIDRFELRAVGYDSAEQGILQSIAESHIVMMFMVGDKPICIFGISKKVYEHGRVIWCLGTDDIDRHKKDFVLCSRYVIEWWTAQYGRLFNYVSVDNDKAVRWLKRMGAVFGEPTPINEYWDLFCLFTIERRN